MGVITVRNLGQVRIAGDKPTPEEPRRISLIIKKKQKDAKKSLPGIVDDIEIPESELEVTTMRSGGKGGQNVNKVESGVRIKHIPTGINVKCTEERSQHQNRDIALKRVKAQLLAIAQEQKCEEIKAIRGDAVEAAWGAQIRNYVLQPYKMVKDQRCNWESSDTQGFLDGDLESCIGELLRTRAREEQMEKEEQSM